MKIVIRDRNAGLIQELERASQLTTKQIDWSFEVGDIFDHWDTYERDIALVSPANSFGFMNGGIDAVYIQKFGQQLEDRVREEISEWGNFGELLVGQTTMLPLSTSATECLIVAPTMRVPQRIYDATDIFLATRQAVNSAYFSLFKTLLMPGMGTGVGGVSYDRAARNMIMGIVAALSDHKAFQTCAEAFLDAQKFNF